MEHQFHRELKRDVADYFCDNGWQTFQEFHLPDGTIADIFAYCRHRGYLICEVATTYNASKANGAITKYARWCNRLYLASPEEIQLPLGEGRQLIGWIQRHDNIGLLVLTKGRIKVQREPATAHLSAGTTKQLRDRMDLSLKLIESGVPTAGRKEG